MEIRMLSFIKMIALTLCINSASVMAYDVKLVASGFRVPWGLTFLDDQHIVFTERNGDIRLLDLDSGIPSPLLNVPNVLQNGQGGLLDIKQSPFNSHHLYFTYSKQLGAQSATALAMLELNSDHSVKAWKDILVTSSRSKSLIHYGSRIAFDNKYLYLSVGERGKRLNAQNLSNHAGKVLRLLPSGDVPSDNPFVSTKGAMPEIWSYGHRNPQGLFYDLQAETLYEIEHGPRGGDEVNVIKKGVNYGWPVTSHGKEYSRDVRVGRSNYAPGIEAPKWVYIPSIAPSGALLYRGTIYPDLDGKLLIGALKLTHINIIDIHENGELKESERLFQDLRRRVRDIVLSPNGYIFFSTDDGNIYKIEP